MKSSNPSKLGHILAIGASHWRWPRHLFLNAHLRTKRLCRTTTPVALTLAISAALSAGTARAVDIFWTAGTASYNNGANWTGGVIPGTGDHAINNNGSNNVVQINPGDPAWSVVDLIAGNADNASGSYVQSGSSVTVGTPGGWLRLGLNNGSLGIYTLNSGTLPASISCTLVRMARPS